MTNASYKQFCPVAMASEVLCTRWTMVLLREMIAGSTRFNELRRGLPRMSPALLSKRLRELEEAGVVVRERILASPETFAYRLTDAGRDIQPVVEAVGMWGQRWVETEPSLDNLDVELLMWDMRRNLNTDPVPPERTVIEFIYPDLPQSQRRWWLIVEKNRAVDLCHVDPGLDVDLYATGDLRTMTEIWMGLRTVQNAVDQDALRLVGPSVLIESMQAWLGLSPFAVQKKMVG